MIYITSDLHLCHNKEFCYVPRGFDSVYSMNNAILQNWNSIITQNDDVYVLGDLMLNDNTSGISIIKQLNGNIHIILGNHDTKERIKLYSDCNNVVEICYSTLLTYNKYNFYLSHYPSITSNFDDDKPLRARVINLCGHSHTQEKFSDWEKYNSPIYHCELDSHNMFPISIESVIDDIKAYYLK